MAKKLHKPTNELGTGAGLPLDKRPRPVSNPLAIISRPFKIPVARDTSRNHSTLNGRQVRKARLKGPSSYALMEIDTNIVADSDLSVGADGEVVVRGKKGALTSRRMLDSEGRSSPILNKKFTVPIKIDKENAFERQNSQPPPPLGTKRKPTLPPRPLHDPMSEYAIVLYDPTVDIIPEIKEEDDRLRKEQEELEMERKKAEQITNRNKRIKPGKSLAEILGIAKDGSSLKKYPNVPVVIDPKLAKILRPHQISGVKFLFRCTSGLVDASAKGCIMADEMGLGKTLQCIALLWTLLRQSPRGTKTIEKAIVVCPSSLVKNWANEFDKWLGKGTLTPLAIDGKPAKGSTISSQLSQWAMATGRNIVRPVLIVSYETLRRNVESLKGTKVGLMLADEGHRLKNGDSLTFTALNSLDCERRVILSGTPIQNDLSEYFSLLTFANPGLLGTRNEFRKNYENPILRGRDSLADDKEREKGDQKLKELTEIVARFIIRRTNDILSKYLPVKYEYVIFCNLSETQKSLYQRFTASKSISKLVKEVGGGAQSLQSIGLLKKLCTHPNLLNLPEDIEGCENLIPDDYDYGHGNRRNREVQVWHSSKFLILQRFLYKINKETNDKIVIISNYTQTLDLIEKLCISSRYGSLRLDGTMNINKRQKLVDKFNNPEGKEFVFLLSSKAGGCGINLIGANRLILVDPDWNPASDQQALARVWRDGQTKNCFIYRFIATGSIEEKIFQRQSAKLQLSSCVVDSNDDVERLFSADNLKQLFQFKENTFSETHSTYNCKRCHPDGKQFIKSSAMLYGDPTTWNHIHPGSLTSNEDTLIANEAQFNDISYCFQYISH
ncbi:hypothetical protein LJB42_004912 [Komagataella kurtzmanii]|nr:hypothetical protein LJB42_004912 [Komagataella kurtzmanii]